MLLEHVPRNLKGGAVMRVGPARLLNRENLAGEYLLDLDKEQV